MQSVVDFVLRGDWPVLFLTLLRSPSKKLAKVKLVWLMNRSTLDFFVARAAGRLLKCRSALQARCCSCGNFPCAQFKPDSIRNHPDG
jgi:hypothetical protein